MDVIKQFIMEHTVTIDCFEGSSITQAWRCKRLTFFIKALLKYFFICVLLFLANRIMKVLQIFLC